AATRFLEAAAAAGIPPGGLYAGLAAAEQAWPAAREAATRQYEAAFATALDIGVPADIAAVAVSWGERLIAAGDFARAGEIAGRVARWADHDFDCAVLQARLYRALGQRQPWQAALGQARALAGERELPAVLTTPSGTAPGVPARTGSTLATNR